MKDYADIGELTSYLSYDPNGGLFRWLKKPNKKIIVGSVAGHTYNTQDGNQYVAIGFRGKRYLAHRLAWLFYHGEYPTCLIDHENGIGTDNRLVNLREATALQNRHNSRKKKPGLKGSHKASKGERYRSSIRVEGKRIHLGCFSTPEDAHAAYVAAAEKYFGEFARAA
jgi:HNH endonuclease